MSAYSPIQTEIQRRLWEADQSNGGPDQVMLRFCRRVHAKGLLDSWGPEETEEIRKALLWCYLPNGCEAVQYQTLWIEAVRGMVGSPEMEELETYRDHDLGREQTWAQEGMRSIWGRLLSGQTGGEAYAKEKILSFGDDLDENGNWKP